MLLMRHLVQLTLYQLRSLPADRAPTSRSTRGPPLSVLSAIYTQAKLQRMDPSMAQMIGLVLVRGCRDAGVEPPAWLDALSH